MAWKKFEMMPLGGGRLLHLGQANPVQKRREPSPVMEPKPGTALRFNGGGRLYAPIRRKILIVEKFDRHDKIIPPRGAKDSPYIIKEMRACHILWLHQHGRPDIWLANRFGMPLGNVRNILRRKTYKEAIPLKPDDPALTEGIDGA